MVMCNDDFVNPSFPNMDLTHMLVWIDLSRIQGDMGVKMGSILENHNHKKVKPL